MPPETPGDQIAVDPFKQGNIADEASHIVQEGARLLGQFKPGRQNETPTIGVATMNADGSIMLDLHTHGGIEADAHLKYNRNDRLYGEISEHLGGLKPGQVKIVQPWNDQIQREDITTPPGGGNDGGQQPGDATPKPKPAPVAPSADFSNRVNDTYNGLPQNVRDALAKDGVKVVPTDKVTDIMPELAGQKPRGWPPGSSWDDVDGAYDIGGKRIIVAQRQSSPTPTTNDIAGLTRHETGHAVDHLHNFSSRADFQTAYDREVAVVPTADTQPLDYFLQKGDAGREETFAETFAITNGGATAPIRETLMKKDFPDTIKIVIDQTSKL